MKKTWLIIKREYITRVKAKTFLLSTFLMPLLFIALIVGVIFITVKNEKEEKKKISFQILYLLGVGCNTYSSHSQSYI